MTSQFSKDEPLGGEIDQFNRTTRSQVSSAVSIDDEEKRNISLADGHSEGDVTELSHQSAGSDGASSKNKAGYIRENTNVYKSAFHIFKANVGTGVFLLPTFYKDSGYVMGAILGIFIGTCVIDASFMLLNAKLTINQHRVDTYSKVCGFVFGRPLQWLLFVALILTQFGFCLMYIQFVAGMMDHLVTPFNGSSYVWMTMTFAIVFPITCFSDNLSLLAIASITATLAVTFALISTLVRSIIEIHSMGGINSATNVAGTNMPIGWFNNLANNMMVLEGIAIVLPVYAGCNQKSKFKPMLGIVLACVVGFYLLYGIVGYLAYGDHLTNSLIDGMPDDGLSIAIRITFIINLICTHPVQFQSAIQLIDQLIGCRARSLKGILVRFIINAAITGLAMGIGPDTVNIVVSFIGALPATVMVLIIPALLNLQVFYAVKNPEEDRVTLAYWKKIFTDGPICSWLRFRCYLYLVLGLLIMVIGTYSIAINL
ncbi:amino acid transporter [Trypanosoma theileri]|uniref:Amino acid transporter n=1 Tax=Trypanosoma theileri TaxID=67003 RepID=A0A1X0NZK6_9TRYP|nr:amino acid transporter [Trypanosoma theileri]ORC89923.1 amino acid transporter [Trypanosoma theileri]